MLDIKVKQTGIGKENLRTRRGGVHLEKKGLTEGGKLRTDFYKGG